MQIINQSKTCSSVNKAPKRPERGSSFRAPSGSPGPQNPGWRPSHFNEVAICNAILSVRYPVLILRPHERGCRSAWQQRVWQMCTLAVVQCQGLGVREGAWEWRRWGRSGAPAEGARALSSPPPDQCVFFSPSAAAEVLALVETPALTLQLSRPGRRAAHSHHEGSALSPPTAPVTRILMALSQTKSGLF